jgi:hypothetical protein
MSLVRARFEMDRDRVEHVKEEEPLGPCGFVDTLKNRRKL